MRTSQGQYKVATKTGRKAAVGHVAFTKLGRFWHLVSGGLNNYDIAYLLKCLFFSTNNSYFCPGYAISYGNHMWAQYKGKKLAGK